MSMEETAAVSMHCRFAARLEEIDRDCVEIRTQVQAVASRKDVFAIDLILREALLNAVIHGSRRDPAKTVDCRLAIEDGWVEITVADEGPGFDWRGVLERGPSDPWAESGRGLGICTAYAANVSFNAEGNRVTIKRKMTGGGGDVR
jgi:serine/threonine-protein kinase RsbW